MDPRDLIIQSSWCSRIIVPGGEEARMSGSAPTSSLNPSMSANLEFEIDRPRGLWGGAGAAHTTTATSARPYHPNGSGGRSAGNVVHQMVPVGHLLREDGRRLAMTFRSKGGAGKWAGHVKSVILAKDQLESSRLISTQVCPSCSNTKDGPGATGYVAQP